VLCCAAPTVPDQFPPQRRTAGNILAGSATKHRIEIARVQPICWPDLVQQCNVGAFQVGLDPLAPIRIKQSDRG
jgi:hypothetical protein